MKTLKQLILIIVLASLTFACSSDDDNSSAQTVKQMLMSGKWYLEKYGDTEGTPCQKKSFVHFFDQNKFEEISYYEENSGSGDCYVEYMGSGTFTLTNDEIINVQFDSGSAGEFYIISIDSESLVIEMYATLMTYDKTEG